MGFDLPVMNRLRRSGRALSPASLFATGAQGVIYDPRDLSTMFQDSLGTTPVTAPGQVVGLRLDKSKGLALGDELVANGGASSGTTGWTATNATLTVVSGGFSVAATAGYGLMQQSLTDTGTKTWLLTFQVISETGTNQGVVNIYDGSTVVNSSVANLRFGVGTHRVVVRQTGLALIQFRVETSGQTVVYDNISVRELAGNHAVQATAGARLTYGIEPKTGTRNALIWTEDFTSTVWVISADNVDANAAIAPNGTQTADRIKQQSIILPRQGASFVSGTSYAFSVYAKADTASSVTFYINGLRAAEDQNIVFDLVAQTATVASGTATAAIQAVGNGWFRLSYTRAANQTASGYFAVSNCSGVYLWGAQLETGTVATAYQKVVTAFEVTEAGIPTCHYCAYAGANSMATAAIDFTATDKMSIFAGVRKLSDTALGMVVELSTGGGNGVFFLSAPRSPAGANYSFYNQGTAGIDGVTLSTFTAPVSNILTALGDISGDRSTLRVNGTQVVQATNDLGTGNYGNYSLYFGRRNNATFPFTGRDYGIVIVGKATSAAEINITEAWLAANTPTVVL